MITLVNYLLSFSGFDMEKIKQWTHSSELLHACSFSVDFSIDCVIFLPQPLDPVWHNLPSSYNKGYDEIWLKQGVKVAVSRQIEDVHIYVTPTVL